MNKHADPRLGRALEVNMLEAARKLGAQLKKVGADEYHGPCPACGGRDRFVVTPGKGIFLCRGAEHDGGKGDVVNMVRHAARLDFAGALEFLTGERREPRDRKLSNMREDAPPAEDDGGPPFDPDEPREGAPAADARAAEDRLKYAAMRAPPAATYDYRDEMGVLVSQKLRFEWRGLDGAKRKTFLQRRPARAGDPSDKIRNGFVYTRSGFERVPYRLADIQQAIAEGETIIIAEGEKKADLLAGWGFAATCTDQGAGQWAPELNQYFRGADIVILPDNDPQSVNKDGKPLFHKDGRPRIPGKDHAQAVGRALRPYAKRIRQLDIPGLPLKGDVVDFAAAGGNAEQLFDLIADRAQPWAPERPGSRFGAMLWSDLDKPGPEIEYLIDDIITVGDRSILGGESQSGKTFAAMHMGMCVATGQDFFGHKVQRGLVVYQAGESAKGAKKRMRAWRRHFNIAHDAPLPFVLLTQKIDLFSDPEAAMAIVEELQAWGAYFPDYPLRLFVIDTLAKASLGAEENSAKEMGVVLDNAEKIESATGAHVMLVHHMNAQGKSLRGSTAIRANIDQVAFVHCDKETRVRTLSIEKQKEDAEADPIKFELMQVKLGFRPDGKEITSCVILPEGQKEEARRISREGFFLREGVEDLAFRALLKALAEHGATAGPSVQVAAGTRVVEGKRWFLEYRRIAPYSSDDERQRVNTARQALKRAEAKFIKFGLIGKDDPHIWHTGKPVRGFPETFPKEDRQARAKPNGAHVDDKLADEIRDVGDIL